MNPELKKLVDQYGFENVLDSLLEFESNKLTIGRVEWLHALNRRINAWCFKKAIEK